MLALVLAMLAGCAAPAAVADGAADQASTEAPGVAEARLGETVRLGGLSVRPIALLEDSRQCRRRSGTDPHRALANEAPSRLTELGSKFPLCSV